MKFLGKSVLLATVLAGAIGVSGASAQEFLTQDDILAQVNAAMGSGGGVVGIGVGTGDGTVSGSESTGGGDMEIGGTEGTSVADASGGSHNLAQGN